MSKPAKSPDQCPPTPANPIRQRKQMAMPKGKSK